jgi:hypothetical protein
MFSSFFFDETFQYTQDSFDKDRCSIFCIIASFISKRSEDPPVTDFRWYPTVESIVLGCLNEDCRVVNRIFLFQSISWMSITVEN